MADFKKALAKVLKWEGGFAEHPSDPGGRTNKGITQKTYNYYYEGDVLHITDEQVETIYRIGFWNKIKGDYINSQSVAELLFDYAVNSGVKTAVVKIQRILKVADDGVLGPKTLEAINSRNAKALFDELHSVRATYYKQLVTKNPSLKVFYRGWCNRLNSYTFQK